jgi:hypothetical protein
MSLGKPDVLVKWIQRLEAEVRVYYFKGYSELLGDIQKLYQELLGDKKNLQQEVLATRKLILESIQFFLSKL